MNKIILLLIGCFFLSCDQKGKDNRPKEANMACHEFFVKGQFNNEIYRFCGIVPVETGYKYKKEEWKFWNLKGQIIVEGIYKLRKTKIEGNGGCPYEITEGIIDREEWKFWDDNGNSIKPNEQLIQKIEICTDEFMVKDVEE